MGKGGGLEEAGEDIEVLELDADVALAMAARGEIMDGKTIMLLQYLHLHVLKPRSMMILVAGPYRSGTNDDPARIDANVAAMQAHALPLYERGHVPVLGEWLALPIVRAAGSQAIGDAVYHAIFLSALRTPAFPLRRGAAHWRPVRGRGPDGRGGRGAWASQ